MVWPGPTYCGNQVGSMKVMGLGLAWSWTYSMAGSQAITVFKSTTIQWKNPYIAINIMCVCVIGVIFVSMIAHNKIVSPWRLQKCVISNTSPLTW